MKVIEKGPAAAKARANNKYRILYVEDEDQNWEIAELSLRDRYALVRAASSKAAIKALDTERFDAVLMDIQLSGSDLSGIDLTQIFRGTFKGLVPPYAGKVQKSDVPIIFVTAYNARYSREDLIAAGGDELIPKPVDFTRLALAISRLLVRRAQGK